MFEGCSEGGFRLTSKAPEAAGSGHTCDRSCPSIHSLQTRGIGVVINPGSAAGDYGNITYDVNPSFVLMDIDGLRIVVSVYELNIDGGVQVDRIGLKKTTATTHSPFIESAACRILSFCSFFFSWYCIWIKVKRVTILMI
jgi:hypothetical protein